MLSSFSVPSPFFIAIELNPSRCLASHEEPRDTRRTTPGVSGNPFTGDAVDEIRNGGMIPAFRDPYREEDGGGKMTPDRIAEKTVFDPEMSSEIVFFQPLEAILPFFIYSPVKPAFTTVLEKTILY